MLYLCYIIYQITQINFIHFYILCICMHMHTSTYIHSLTHAYNYVDTHKYIYIYTHSYIQICGFKVSLTLCGIWGCMGNYSFSSRIWCLSFLLKVMGGLIDLTSPGSLSHSTIPLLRNECVNWWSLTRGALILFLLRVLWLWISLFLGSLYLNSGYFILFVIQNMNLTQL